MELNEMDVCEKSTPLSTLKDAMRDDLCLSFNTEWEYFPVISQYLTM